MRRVTHILDTEAETSAFAAGVRWVNDSALEEIDSGPTDDGGYFVAYTDRDGDEDTTFDLRGAELPF